MTHAPAPNIKFTYVYRDSSNYKQWGTVVFRNPDLTAAYLWEQRLDAAFMIDRTFIADQIRVPEIFLFHAWQINADDHCIHEFHSLEATHDDVTDKHRRSILEFVEEAESAARRGWDGFIPGASFGVAQRFKIIL